MMIAEVMRAVIVSGPIKKALTRCSKPVIPVVIFVVN